MTRCLPIYLYVGHLRLRRYRAEDEDSSPVTKTNEKDGASPAGGEQSPPPEKERADREDTEKRHALPHNGEEEEAAAVQDDLCHEAGPNSDLYAVPVKLRHKREHPAPTTTPALPPGWEKHEDNGFG
ncbi:hypothetical protein EVAR_60275_1 [Eumeta japonica]|uniref:Uncharacterized protein n=1 Tax=Eumeta variegata TaxID=151549 RepID=A0A4C1Z7X4_EUMVA|nr:hypothetical protein EVAR_60275_1 [Eumeta japonica]